MAAWEASVAAWEAFAAAWGCADLEAGSPADSGVGSRGADSEADSDALGSSRSLDFRSSRGAAADIIHHRTTPVILMTPTDGVSRTRMAVAVMAAAMVL